MKALSKLISAATVIVALTAFSSCKSREDKRYEEPVGVEIRTDEDNTRYFENEKGIINDTRWEKERSDYRSEQERMIERNEDRIDELKAQLKDARKDMREEYRERIETLRENNRQLKDRLDKYNDNNRDKWESFKREFNHDMDELGRSLKNITIDNKK